MRILLALALLVVATATAAAQGNPAVGPCAGAADLDSATKATIAAKPDRKPRRQDDIVVQDRHFQMLSSADDDRNLEGPKKWVVASGVVDTTGRLDPKTATIVQSSSISLSHAVCDAIVKVAFSPALLHGEKVRAMYQERFIFRSGVTNVDIDQAINHGGDRH
jgi:hypothetical protein